MHTTTQRSGGAALRFILVAAATSMLLLAAGCGKKAAAPKPNPVVEVGVVKLAAQSITLTKEYPGRTSAYRVAEVRARVNGIVLKRFFTEGGLVKEGDQLYQIDAAPYEAALASARATLVRAEANFASALLQAQRYAELVKAKAVSQQDYDNALANAKALEADVLAGRAAVVNAEINLSYTRVYAPISGRIGRAEVTEGAYVQAGTATLLAVVQQTDPIYVDLVQPASEVARLRAELESGRLQVSADGKASVKLFFDDGRSYADAGTLQFTDITVSPSTSSITVRAIFPNTRGELLPGLFVRAQLVEGVVPEGILAPQQGVTRNPRGQPTALVVGDAVRAADTKIGKPGEPYKVAELRILKVDRSIGASWLVTDGLKPGDEVIVENLQRIRPSTEISPVPAQSNASQSAIPRTQAGAK